MNEYPAPMPFEINYYRGRFALMTDDLQELPEDPQQQSTYVEQTCIDCHRLIANLVTTAFFYKETREQLCMQGEDGDTLDDTARALVLSLPNVIQSMCHAMHEANVVSEKMREILDQDTRRIGTILRAIAYGNGTYTFPAEPLFQSRAFLDPYRESPDLQNLLPYKLCLHAFDDWPGSKEKAAMLRRSILVDRAHYLLLVKASQVLGLEE